MPVTGPPHLENGYPDRPDQGYGSRFDKADEQAAAGYYRTVLQDYGVEVELTARIAMEEGVRFAVREGGRTVGSGVITKVIE